MGVNAGDGSTSCIVPGSFSPAIINVTSTSNVGIPGRWMFGLNNLNSDCLNSKYNRSNKIYVLGVNLMFYLLRHIFLYCS